MPSSHCLGFVLLQCGRLVQHLEHAFGGILRLLLFGRLVEVSLLREPSVSRATRTGNWGFGWWKTAAEKSEGPSPSSPRSLATDSRMWRK